MFSKTLSKEVLQTDTVTNNTEEAFSHNKENESVMCVGYTILTNEA